MHFVYVYCIMRLVCVSMYRAIESSHLVLGILSYFLKALHVVSSDSNTKRIKSIELTGIVKELLRDS